MHNHKACIVLLWLTLITQATLAAPINPNETTGLPKGTFPRGDLICRPTRWTDVVSFILTNYVAHAATIRTLPGEQPLNMLIGVLTALFFPINGVFRAIDALVRHPVFLLGRGKPLQGAARAGALCMVVRSNEWQPEADQELRFTKIQHLHSKEKKWCEHGIGCRRGIARPQETVNNIPQDDDVLRSASAKVYNPDWCREVKWYHFLLRGKFTNTVRYRTIHGRCDLVQGYRVQHVPPDARVRFSEDPRKLNVTAGVSSERGRARSRADDNAGGPQQETSQQRLWLGSSRIVKQKPNTISSSYSWVKALVALLQSMWSVSTLVRARGDQIETFGYAAFGLTVTPYAIMSMVNLIANLVCPTYPALYLVHSEVLDEAVRRGSKVDGVVGELVPSNPKNFNTVKVMDWESRSGSLRILSPNSRVRTNESDVQRIRIKVPSCTPFQRIGIDNERPFRSPDRCVFNNEAKHLLKMWIFPPLLGAVLVTIFGIMSRFSPGSSTLVQRIWVMCWMIFGCVSAYEPAVEALDNKDGKPPSRLRTLIPVIVYAAAAIGGYIMVVQMLYTYGTCVMVT